MFGCSLEYPGSVAVGYVICLVVVDVVNAVRRRRRRLRRGRDHRFPPASRFAVGVWAVLGAGFSLRRLWSLGACHRRQLRGSSALAHWGEDPEVSLGTQGEIECPDCSNTPASCPLA